MKRGSKAVRQVYKQPCLVSFCCVLMAFSVKYQRRDVEAVGGGGGQELGQLQHKNLTENQGFLRFPTGIL